MQSTESVHLRGRRAPRHLARRRLARRSLAWQCRERSAICALTLWALSLAVGCTGASDEPLPPASLVLITLDTTRADHLGAYGDPSASTPNLDQLAREGMLYTAAQATAPLTLPSHTSIMTGTYPIEHGVRDNGIFKLDTQARTVAEGLREAGWRTGAFVASDVLGPRFGLGQGFERYDSPGTALELSADTVVEGALAWLAALPADAPYFLWVHFHDPHQPWTPPEPFASRMADPYAAEIAFMDAELGRLLAGLDAARPNERRLIAVTADHGEALGEHGEHTHGMLLNQPVTHIPLILSGSALSEEGRGTRISVPVSQADLAPTLIEVAGLDAAAVLPDTQLPALLDSRGRPQAADATRALYIESFAPYFTYRWHPLQAVVIGNEKLIAGPSDELYDLARDPKESRDLGREAPERAQAMRTALDALIERHPPRNWSQARVVSTQEAAQLAALGYVTGSASDVEISPDLPHPREHIGIIRQMRFSADKTLEWRKLQRPVEGESEAQASDRQRRATEALEVARETLRNALESAPDSPLVLVELGSLECALGAHEAGIPLMTRGAQGRPDDASVRFDLALCQHSAGHADEAVEYAERAIELSPNTLYYYSGLFYILTQSDNTAHAVSVLDRMEATRARLTPDDTETRTWIEHQRTRLVPE